MKDMMVVIAGLFGKRFTDKQKGRFIRYMQNRAQEAQVKFVLEDGHIGRRACRNIYLGSLKRARILLTVPYDTPTRILWPGIHYYPMNAGKNAARDSAAKALDLLLAAGLAGAYYLFVFCRFLRAGGPAVILPAAGMLLTALLTAGIVCGFENRNNYTRNSASIAIALECLRRFGKNAVAVALLDHSCCGFGGYQQLAAYMENKGLTKRIVALDCVASGREFHLHCLEKGPAVQNVQRHQIADSAKKQCVSGIFPDIMVLTGGSRLNGETIVRNTRCRKDCQIDLAKMEQTVDVIHALIVD